MNSKKGHAEGSSWSSVRVFKTDYTGSEISSWLSECGVACEAFDASAIEGALVDETTRCVIIWGDPVERIASALEAGDDAGHVFQSWMESSNTLLSLVRRNRRQIVLADARTLARPLPEGVLETLRGFLQCETLRPLSMAGVQEDQTLARILADLVFAEKTSAQKMLDEIEASGISTGTVTPKEADLTVISRLFGQTKAIEEENGLLRTQITLQQQEDERSHYLMQSMEERHQRASLEADRALSRALSDLRAEAKARQGLEKQCNRLMRRVGDLSSKLDKVFASTSWRLTLPIRKAKTMLTGGDKPIDVLIAEQRQQEKTQ